MPFIDFAALRERCPIDAVASILPNVKWRQETNGQLRATCPVHGGERGLVVTPEKGMFICQALGKGGDCIGLYAHIMQCSNYEAAQALEQEFGAVTVNDSTTVTVRKNRATEADVPERASTSSAAPSSPKTGAAGPFDPQAYLEKLEFTDEVAALGISQDDAAKLGIGYSSTGLHKGIAFAMRWPSGEIAGFCSVLEGRVKLPKHLIPPTVIPLHNKRRA